MNELKNHLLTVENEEILPLIKDLSKKREFWARPRIFSMDSKLSQLTTKVESLEKLYSYTRIPEYKLIKFRDEMLDATSSESVRNTLATARAVDETLEILGFNGNYPKVKDRLEEKITSDKKDAPKENKKPEKVEDKKELSKEQPVPENKKETPKVTSDKKDASNNKKQETSENNAPVENKVLSATLSGRDVAVSFDKNKIDADNVFVGAINDENLNKAIIEKLGNEYKVIEVFEIHFKKDGKKIDSDAERTVKVSVVKNDNAELEVYHIADNNVLEKVESSYSNGSLQFKINHFSKFTILERIRVGAKDLESRVQIVAPVSAGYTEKDKKQTSSSGNDFKNVEVNKKETEELPKTGLESTKPLGIALLALGSAIAIRRKQKQ